MRTKLKPASGVVQWIEPLDILGYGILAINGVEYLLSPIVHRGKLTGWELGKTNGVFYHIDLTDDYGWKCGCPDAEFRYEREYNCKHSLALIEALRDIGNKEPIVFGKKGQS